MNESQAPSGASYSTGGGGVVLEHRIAATLLASLLAGDAMPLLGDDAAPKSIKFQASPFSPVDDLFVRAATPDGGVRKLSIAVRRSPKLIKSDAASVGLFAPYVRITLEHWVELSNGTWRLGLAVAASTPGTRQLEELAEFARANRDAPSFHAEVRRPGRTNQGVRARLAQVEALIDLALDDDLDAQGTQDVGELTWRFLTALRVMSCRIEGADQTDRTNSVRRLQSLTKEQSPAAADALFTRLAELAGSYAPQAAEVDALALRRDLAGFAFADSPQHAKGLRVLKSLAERLVARTGFRLASGEADLELDRGDVREPLQEAMRVAVSTGSTLLVTGEPDVGKSALTLRAAEKFAADGPAVTVLSLRDLPATTLELENSLGGHLDEVLASAASGPGRLLVVDGAEAALEGRGGLLADLARAALGMGYGVVAVTRRDGRGAVAKALSAGDGREPSEHEIPGLTASERAQLTATFAALSGLKEDARSNWLLSRPGLVDLLLRSGPGADLSAGVVSEAHVFAIIWAQLVRRGEEIAPGEPSPDAREQALIELAHREMLPSGSKPTAALDALASLRSDGLLLPAGPTSAWSPGDHFASDLVRDFAIARLLIVEGWELLKSTGAPRWALRAVRLACQASLVQSGDETEATRLKLQAECNALGDQYGRRWIEVPLEALLTLGDGGKALERAWLALTDGDAAGLATVLRISTQRYSAHGFGEPQVLAPVVRLAYCGSTDFGQSKRYSETGEQIREVVLNWLRGLTRVAAPPDRLRQRVRDRVLDSAPPFYDEFALEVLGTLGPDLDERASGFLKTIGEDSPGHLRHLVESAGASLAMSASQPALLLELTEAYYIEAPRRDRFGLSGMDDGIRHHDFGGIGSPMASWYNGPFFCLLNVEPRETIELINRMLDHATAIRVGQLRELNEELPTDTESIGGMEFELPVVGRRHCIGDDHAWRWYRGSSVGPYPCMSALLALERFCDYLIETVRFPLEKIAEMLLRDGSNLAMPGLVVGLFVRHLDGVGDLLDSSLEDPRIWQLEFTRIVSEGHLHVQGADDPGLKGRDRRRYSFREVAAQMTITARMNGDEERLATLGQIADKLVCNARAEGYAGVELAAVEGWAAAMRSENYKAEPHESGGIAIDFEPPGEVESALRGSLESITKTNKVLGLRLKYTKTQDRSALADGLLEDLEIARSLAQDTDVLGDLFAADGIAAVAAAGIVAHARGIATVPDAGLSWAAGILIEAAINPQVDQMSFESSSHDSGADRSAGAALPLLLLPCFDQLGIESPRLREALNACSESIFDEVRAAAACGFRGLWSAECRDASGSERCFHELAWEIVEGGLRDCRMGDWEGGRRGVAPLEPPYGEALAAVPTDSLLANRLVHPLIAASDASLASCCVADRARVLLEVLHAADRRAARHWAEEGYGHFSDHQRALVARMLIERALANEDAELHAYVREFLLTPAALNQLLRDLLVAFTYGSELRPRFAEVWRGLAVAALDEIEAGTRPMVGDRTSDEAVAHLIPTPEINIAESDPDGVIAKAEEGWIEPAEIADLFERWVPLAAGRAQSVDAVTRFSMTAGPQWQADTGLAWVERTIAGAYETVANSCWFLVDWLGRLRTEQALPPDAANAWRRVVDSLAAAGDARAAKLQQAEE